jgi:hypothetical protein
MFELEKKFPQTLFGRGEGWVVLVCFMKLLIESALAICCKGRSLFTPPEEKNQNRFVPGLSGVVYHRLKLPNYEFEHLMPLHEKVRTSQTMKFWLQMSHNEHKFFAFFCKFCNKRRIPPRLNGYVLLF